MNSPGFDFKLLKVMRYRFFLFNDGRYPTLLLLNPADCRRLLNISLNNCETDLMEMKDDVYYFSGVRIIRSDDIPFGTFEFYLNINPE